MSLYTASGESSGWVLPLDSRDDYRPGRQLSLDVGYRYGAIRDVGLMLQLNYHVKDRDSGANARCRPRSPTTHSAESRRAPLGSRAPGPKCCSHQQ